MPVLEFTAGTAKATKPVLHGQHWIAITGKPLAATAGAQIFSQGGNAIDAACAMLAATCTMHDALSWGGETQALIFDPREKKVVGINALGVAPTGATADFFIQQGLRYPPGDGAQAAVTPGTPGGLMIMLAHYGTFPGTSLKTRHGIGSRIPYRDGHLRVDRGFQRNHQTVGVFHARFSSSSWRSLRGAAAGRNFSSTRPVVSDLGEMRLRRETGVGQGIQPKGSDHGSV